MFSRISILIIIDYLYNEDISKLEESHELMIVGIRSMIN